MAYYLVAQIFDIFFFQSQAVIIRIFLPVFQFDHQIDLLLFLDALYTIQSLYIYDANAPQFNKMPGHFRRSSDQCMFIDLADFHYIIRNQTMSAADQFQSRLAFSDSTVSCNHETLAIYIDQNPVNGNTGCQFFTQCIDQLCHKFRSRTIRTKNRHFIFYCLF